MKSEELQAIMDNYTGTEHIYNNPMMTMRYTDGVKGFLVNAEAYWLISDIYVYRKEAIKKNPDEYMFSVRLVVKDDKADLTFKDGNGHICFEHHYSFTDCPSGDWLFYYYVNEDLLIWNGEY